MSYKKLSSIGKIEEEKFEILVPEIKTKEDKDEMKKHFRIVLVYVYANWCGPCKIVAPLFNRLFKKYNLNGVVGLVKENVELRLLPQNEVIPTFQFFVDGKLESIETGADIVSIEDKLIYYIKNTFENTNPYQQPTPPPQLNPQ